MTAVDQGPATTALSHEHLSPVLGRYFQRTWVRGEGHRLWDGDGREILDFACGIAVTVLGHRHPRVNAAIHAQVDTLMHMCNGLGYLDLDYSEDSRAEVDFNVVGTDAGTYVELQGTAEGPPFDRARVDALLDLANSGLARLFEAQASALAVVRR